MTFYEWTDPIPLTTYENGYEWFAEGIESEEDSVTTRKSHNSSYNTQNSSSKQDNERGIFLQSTQIVLQGYIHVKLIEPSENTLSNYTGNSVILTSIPHLHSPESISFTSLLHISSDGFLPIAHVYIPCMHLGSQKVNLFTNERVIPYSVRKMLSKPNYNIITADAVEADTDSESFFLQHMQFFVLLLELLPHFLYQSIRDVIYATPERFNDVFATFLFDIKSIQLPKQTMTVLRAFCTTHVYCLSEGTAPAIMKPLFNYMQAKKSIFERFGHDELILIEQIESIDRTTW
ncbi:hypothetical protein PCE1_002003 [Barthelona sp. PCE]